MSFNIRKILEDKERSFLYSSISLTHRDIKYNSIIFYIIINVKEMPNFIKYYCKFICFDNICKIIKNEDIITTYYLCKMVYPKFSATLCSDGDWKK